MELVKKNIHMDRIKCKAGTQITLEDDVNISDAKPDAGRLIFDRGNVVLEEVKATQDHVNVKGRLDFGVMYLTEGDDAEPACMEGSIPFEEQLYMEGVQSGDNVEAEWELEDLTIGLINSRKLSVQAIVSLSLELEEMYDEETAVDLYYEEPVEYRKKPLQIAQLAIRKKDIFRLKEEVELPQSLPNIFQVIWESVRLGEVECKPLEEKLSLQGEVQVFLLYEGEGEDRPIRYFETTLPFSGTVDCHGCDEKMLQDIDLSISHKDTEVRPDFDGEDRVYTFELVLDLDIRLYEEERLDILSDVYGVVKEIQAVGRQAGYKRLLSRSGGKSKVTGHVKSQGGDAHIMQVIHSECALQVEEQSIVENGISVRGTLNIQTLYGSSEHKYPYSCVKGVLPFQYVLDVPGIGKDCVYKLKAGVESLNISMVDNDELEVKAVLDFKALVFDNHTENVVADVNVSELDMDKVGGLPGIVVYIAGEGESLWDVGKKYYVPIAQIKETNELTSEEIKAGDKLLIVKGLA